MKLGLNDPDWIGGGAACLDEWDLFAPAEVEGVRREPKHDKRERVALALSICNACPMLEACRVWAFKARPYGTVVGGLDLTGMDDPALEDEAEGAA